MIACYQILHGAEEKIIVDDFDEMVPSNLK